MRWANFLHIYQPPHQLPDIFERIVFESYRPIIRGLKKYRAAKISLNINAVLTEKLWQKGHHDVIQDIKKLAQNGQIEFLESAKYHAFLPKLPIPEIVRQIKLNHQTNHKFFGHVYQPQGFFSPEMAYAPSVAQVAKKLGYRFLLADEIAFNGQIGRTPFSHLYTIKGLGDFKIIFKERRTSELIVQAIVRSGQSLRQALRDEIPKNRYLLTAMDGETFGHHRPGLEELLYDIFGQIRFQNAHLAEIVQSFPVAGAITPLDSTWSTFAEDLQKGLPYKLWFQSDNPIQQLQWQFTNFLIQTVKAMRHHQTDYQKARGRLDQALNSCQYWWASKYWWSVEAIEQGAYDLKMVIVGCRSVSAQTKRKIDDYYRQILDLVFQWQRTGIIREFHMTREEWQTKPFKKRTHPEWFNQMILEFEAAMRHAARKQEYEQAIKWRDAIYKLRSGADVYDILHVVNELWTVRQIPSAKPFLQHKRFSKFARKYFLPLPKKRK